MDHSRNKTCINEWMNELSTWKNKTKPKTLCRFNKTHMYTWFKLIFEACNGIFDTANMSQDGSNGLCCAVLLEKARLHRARPWLVCVCACCILPPCGLPATGQADPQLNFKQREATLCLDRGAAVIQPLNHDISWLWSATTLVHKHTRACFLFCSFLSFPGSSKTQTSSLF